MLLIELKYCGGCNPEIDRCRVIENVEEGLEEKGLEVKFITEREAKRDLILLVNGCRHACLEEEYAVSEEGLPVISIRGEMVGDGYVREEDIPKVLINKIFELIPSEDRES